MSSKRKFLKTMTEQQFPEHNREKYAQAITVYEALHQLQFSEGSNGEVPCS
jgi:hypothetical protein